MCTSLYIYIHILSMIYVPSLSLLDPIHDFFHHLEHLRTIPMKHLPVRIWGKFMLVYHRKRMTFVQCRMLKITFETRKNRMLKLKFGKHILTIWTYDQSTTQKKFYQILLDQQLRNGSNSQNFCEMVSSSPRSLPQSWSNGSSMVIKGYLLHRSA